MMCHNMCTLFTLGVFIVSLTIPPLSHGKKQDHDGAEAHNAPRQHQQAAAPAAVHPAEVQLGDPLQALRAQQVDIADNLAIWDEIGFAKVLELICLQEADAPDPDLIAEARQDMHAVMTASEVLRQQMAGIVVQIQRLQLQLFA